MLDSKTSKDGLPYRRPPNMVCHTEDSRRLRQTCFSQVRRLSRNCSQQSWEYQRLHARSLENTCIDSCSIAMLAAPHAMACRLRVTTDCAHGVCGVCDSCCTGCFVIYLSRNRCVKSMHLKLQTFRIRTIARSYARARLQLHVCERPRACLLCV